MARLKASAVRGIYNEYNVNNRNAPTVRESNNAHSSGIFYIFWVGFYSNHGHCFLFIFQHVSIKLIIIDNYIMYGNEMKEEMK